MTYGYDNLGHTTSVSQSGHTLTFGYDSLGNLRTQTGPQGTLTSDYDPAGRRIRLTWPDTFFVDYDYLVTGEMTAIREKGVTSGIGLLAKYEYDNLGHRTTLTRGNGTVTSYQYDSESRLEQLSQNLAATAADQAVGMGYNPAGQISTRTSSNDVYSWTENQNTSRSYTINALNQYTAVGSVGPTYDARGNLTNFGADAYGYSSENLLTSAPGGTTLSYDPMGRLYQTSSTTVTRYAYDGDQLVAEYNANNQLLRRYVHGPAIDEPVVWYEGNATAARRWLHADERGSIVAISNASGEQFAINRYDEHGVPALTNTGRFQFTGQVWVPEAKLYYFKARFYSASLGRFMQTDPIGFAAGVNLYAYVRGDVINRRDPSGLMETVIVTGRRGCDLYCGSILANPEYGSLNALDWIQPGLDGQLIADGPQSQQCLRSGGDGSFTVNDFVNFSAGVGDVLLLGFGDELRGWLDIGSVDMASSAYGAGEVTGSVTLLATGVAGGIRVAGARGAGMEFSHAIPARAGGPRSIWNGNYVTTRTHALSDPYRYRFIQRSWKEANPMPNRPSQLWTRTPNTIKGTAAGAAAATAGVLGAGC